MSVQVPDDYLTNLRFRVKIREQAGKDPRFRKAMLETCRRDIFFFFKTFAWLYEPRPRIGTDGVVLPPIIPFIPWPHQIPVIEQLVKHMGFMDIGVEKSRGEGLSWIACLTILWFWLFRPYSAFGLVSRSEMAVDNPNDPDSLFWKLDWELLQLPRWMAGEKGQDYKRDLNKHILKNIRNDSTIAGYAATGDVASGGRKFVMIMDELAKFPRPADEAAMASTQYVTDSRLVISTPKGADGAYYQLMHTPSGNMKRIIVDWTDNPVRNRGLYRITKYEPVAVDPINNPLPRIYDPPNKEIRELFGRLRKKGFHLEDGVRSPWLDKECDRLGATPQNIAQELGRSYGGSMFLIFGPEFMEVAEASEELPLQSGTIRQADEESRVKLDENRHGDVHLWCPLSVDGWPPVHRYVIGCDVSSGQGGSYTSNSALVVIDLNTGEQVLEYATNTVLPRAFAEQAVGIAKWFHGAYLAWEHGGPGTVMTTRVKELGYPNVFYRHSISRRQRVLDQMGWHPSADSKETLFADMERTIRTKTYIIRSQELRTECQHYARVNGKIECIQRSGADDSNRGLAHGDRVIAMGVAIQASKDRPVRLGEIEAAKRRPPLGSMAERMRDWEDVQVGLEEYNEEHALSGMMGYELSEYSMAAMLNK